MAPPDDYDLRSWLALMGRLDERVDRALQQYIRQNSLNHHDIAAGFTELAKLRQRTEPDYAHVAVPVAYALRYLPFRTAAVIGALTTVADRGVPRRVLDIGSGADAASLALGLWAPGDTMEVTTFEPSPAMRELGGLIDCGNHVTRVRHDGTLELIQRGNAGLDGMSFDAIIMSACLPYGARNWQALAEQVGQLTRPPSVIIAIEPNDKADLLQSLRAGFDQTGWYSLHDYCCHDLPETMRMVRTLPRLTELQSEFYDGVVSSPALRGPGRDMFGVNPDFGRPHDVVSWNSSPYHRDRVLICLEAQPSNDPDDLPF